MVRPFSVVELDLEDARPVLSAPHTEDVYVHPDYRRWIKDFSDDERHSFLQHHDDGRVSNIFGTEILRGPGFYVMAGSGNRSIGTVRAKHIIEMRIESYNGLRPRLSFVDSEERCYDLAVTDLALRYYVRQLLSKMDLVAVEDLLGRTLKTAAEVYLRIGLARGWDRYPDRCYLQINGVYSFPDYLSGRCFADFTGSPPAAMEASAAYEQ